MVDSYFIGEYGAGKIKTCSDTKGVNMEWGKVEASVNKFEECIAS